jgi:hypothetical protein
MTLAARLAAFRDPTAAFNEGAKAVWAQINARRLIWTNDGHKFADELTNDVQWVVHEGGKGIDFIDRWVDKAGNEVSRAVHVYNQAGAVTSATVAGNVNEPIAPEATPATPGATS